MRLRASISRGRLSALGAAIAVVGGLSAAQASDDLLEALARCKALADDRQRLHCLDAAVARVEPLANFGIAPSTQGADPLTTAAAKLSSHDVERGSDGLVEAITANVREWSANARGQLTMVLDNGQAWRQTDAARLHLVAGRAKPHRVRIARAALGSFAMTIDGNNRAYKVKRVSGVKG